MSSPRKQPRRTSSDQPTIATVFGLPDPSIGNEDDDDDTPAAVVAGGGDATPVRRGRGRPPAVPRPLYDDSLPAIDFSLTVVKRTMHVPMAWWHALKAYLDAHAVRYVMSFERGGNAEMLHIQCVVTLHMDPERVKEFIKEIKEAMGFRNGDGQKGSVVFKPLGVGQTFERLTGSVHPCPMSACACVVRMCMR